MSEVRSSRSSGISSGARCGLRIAHVMAGAQSGGAELFYERLSIAQTRAGHDVLSLLRRDPARESRLGEAGVRTAGFRFGGLLDLRTRPGLSRALRAFAPDVAIAWMSRAARMMPDGPWPVAGRLGGYYDLANYRRCSDLIGNTQGLVRWMIAEGWPAERVHHLPNFAADLGNVDPVRPVGPVGGAPFILALGRLHRNKAFDVLIRAMPALSGVHLVIAGEGPERAALEELARREGVAERVHMPGWTQSGGAWLRACDLMVCPSRIEPLGNVVIEGLSAGRPVVASAIQGPQEVLGGTQDGVLVPPEDPAALSAAIAEVLGDPGKAAALSRNGRARFEREFSEPVVLRRWDAFLDGMAKRNGGER
ncbi:glycosyltransferase [Swaminathania salitolerans]|uniref:Glycosyl transferase n=1 Tax=Swaminathania salitolerans TaxID=182838 RepID=A0A511BPM9_9PROT|nr:glycosyltransferase [Swaminathania salitolerans]GEL01604.1 glycosyl transferase [Swaminathania salitolerans]